MVGVECMALVMHFKSFGSLCALILGLLFYLGIDVELVWQGLETALIFNGYKSILEVLGEGQIIVSVSLAWCFSVTSTAW